jgi:hypothetical protein
VYGEPEEAVMGVVVARLKERAEEAERQAARLRKMVELVDEWGEEGLAELAALIAPGETNGNGHSTAINGDSLKDVTNEPRGRAAVRIIVRRRPGPWTMQQLRAEMEREGWFTSASGLEAAVKRLCKENGEGRRLGRGRYVFPADYGEEVTNEMYANGVRDAALIATAQ